VLNDLPYPSEPHPVGGGGNGGGGVRGSGEGGGGDGGGGDAHSSGVTPGTTPNSRAEFVINVSPCKCLE